MTLKSDPLKNIFTIKSDSEYIKKQRIADIDEEIFKKFKSNLPFFLKRK